MGGTIMATVRIGAVNYLNTKPLIYELETLAPSAELILDVPSRLADLLAEGQLDVALIPIIEYFRGGPFTSASQSHIGARAPALSCRALRPLPMACRRSIALRLDA